MVSRNEILKAKPTNIGLIYRCCIGVENFNRVNENDNIHNMQNCHEYIFNKLSKRYVVRTTYLRRCITIIKQNILEILF